MLGVRSYGLLCLGDVLSETWRFRRGGFRFTQFDLSLHSGKAWGTVVENFFRPSECVTDGGSFDSVRLTPHSAHDDSAFLIDAWRFRCGVFRFTQFDLSLQLRQSMGDRGGK